YSGSKYSGLSSPTDTAQRCQSRWTTAPVAVATTVPTVAFASSGMSDSSASAIGCPPICVVVESIYAAESGSPSGELVIGDQPALHQVRVLVLGVAEQLPVDVLVVFSEPGDSAPERQVESLGPPGVSR